SSPFRGYIHANLWMALLLSLAKVYGIVLLTLLALAFKRRFSRISAQ
ncbi:MAG: hypothetical protein GXO39_00270, partial [Thermotogae bacterium]|nr:hypothetical protein [Thermotogota bacterium]